MWMSIVLIFCLVVYGFGESGLNPHNLLLNEIMTREVPGQNQFIEIKRDPSVSDVELKGYSIIVAETTDTPKIAPNLVLRSGWDLGQTVMKRGRMFGIIGRRDYGSTIDDILQFNPTSGTTKLKKRDPKIQPEFDTASNWLTVDKPKIMVVGLLYNSEKSLFDPSVWSARFMDRVLGGKVLEYTKENLIDLVVVSGVQAALQCNDLNFLQEITGKEVKGMPCPSTAQTIFSINRCGNLFTAFTDTWKHGIPTPGQQVLLQNVYE